MKLHDSLELSKAFCYVEVSFLAEILGQISGTHTWVDGTQLAMISSVSHANRSDGFGPRGMDGAYRRLSEYRSLAKY
jgi:hypothetical protein